MKKFILALVLCCTSLTSQAVKIDGVEVGHAIATQKFADGGTSVISMEYCILREITVANALTFSIIKEGKIVVQGCILSLGEDKEPFLIVEGLNFELKKFKIDLSKFEKYEQKGVSYF